MSFYTLVREKIKTDLLGRVASKGNTWRTLMVDEVTEPIVRFVVSDKELTTFNIKEIVRIDDPKRIPSATVRPVFFIVPDEKMFLRIAVDCGYKVGNPITKPKPTTVVIPQKEPLDDTPAPSPVVQENITPQIGPVKKGGCCGGGKSDATEDAPVVTPAVVEKKLAVQQQQQQAQPPPPPYYTSVMIYTTTPVSEDLFATLKDTYGLISICSMFVELNIQFLSYTSNFFSCYYPNSVYTNWRLCAPGQGVEPARFSIEKYISHVAEGIVAMSCACSCGMPLIWSGNKRLPKEMSDNLVISRIARRVYQRLEEIRVSGRLLSKVGEVLDGGVAPMGFKECRLHIIVVDRGYDLLSPMLHQLTHEAFLTDILRLNNQELGGRLGLTAETYFRTVNYKNPTKPVLPFDYKTWRNGDSVGANAPFLQLDDSDPLFRKIKHDDINSAAKWLGEDMAEFKQKNELLKFKASTDASKQVSYDAMRAAVAGKFEYEEKINLYTGHIALLRFAMDHAKSHLFRELVGLEDTLLNGAVEEDELGRRRKIHMPLEMLCEKLAEVLSGLGLLGEDKVRLLLVSYALRSDLLTDSVAAGLKEVAQLSAYEQDVVANMNALSDTGITMAKGLNESGDHQMTQMAEQQKSTKKGLKKKLKALFGRGTEVEDEYKAFVHKDTPLKEMMNACERGRLGVGYNLVNPKWFRQEANVEKPDANTSMVQWMDYIPTQKEVNAFITGGDVVEAEPEKNNSHKLSEAHKVVFFIVGGATVAELKEVAEMNGEVAKKKIGAGGNTFQYYVGSDGIISPNNFIEEIACLSTPYPSFAENRAHDPTFSGKL